MSKRACLTGAILLISAGCSTAEEPKATNDMVETLALEPGLWETVSSVVDVQGPDLPFEVRRRMIGPRPSARGCITAEQAGRLIAGRNCTHQGFAVRDGRLSGRMTCPALPRPTIATIEGRYEARRYSYAMRMQTSLPDGTAMTIEVRGQGRRLGDCPDQPEQKGAGR